MNTSTNFIKEIQKHTYICTVKPEYFKGVKFHKIYKLSGHIIRAEFFFQQEQRDHVILCSYNSVSLITL